MAQSDANITQITPGAARKIAGAVRGFSNLPQNGKGIPNPFNSVFGLVQIGYVTELWTPGTNYVTLQPSDVNGNPIKDSSGANLPTVQPYIGFPLTSPAQCLAAAVNDVLGYVSLGGTVTGDSSPALLLINPPIIPRFNSQYQGMYNNSSDSSEPNLVSDFIRAI